MIEIKVLRRSFGYVEVIKDIDLTIERGEVLCLIGTSRSGKSMLLPCINGLEKIAAGERSRSKASTRTQVNKPQRRAPEARHRLSAVQRLSAPDRSAERRPWRLTWWAFRPGKLPSSWHMSISTIWDCAIVPTLDPRNCRAAISRGWRSQERWR
jgi:energy-coupling factor transporter ATP-binding protein EcfA2